MATSEESSVVMLLEVVFVVIGVGCSVWPQWKLWIIGVLIVAMNFWMLSERASRLIQDRGTRAEC